MAIASSGRAATPAPIAVPIVQQRLPDGTVRFSVSLRIGDGAPIDAMLDTGSFGLRVLAEALTPSQYEETKLRRAYAYESGVVLRGPLARATVSIGAAGSPSPILFQVARSVGCDAAHPRCPGVTLAAGGFGIGGDGFPGAGYQAILGLSLRRVPLEAAPNPLPLLGAPRWIIILPRPDAKAPGQLILNPDENDVAGYNIVPLRRRAAEFDGRTVFEPLDRALPSCPERAPAEQATCPQVLLDTGARPGVAPFYTYAILFDFERGVIGVRRRAPGGRRPAGRSPPP